MNETVVRTIERVRISGKWLEIWFVEGPLIHVKGQSVEDAAKFDYHASYKIGDVWDMALQIDHDRLMSHGLSGFITEWIRDEGSWEIVLMAAPMVKLAPVVDVESALNDALQGMVDTYVSLVNSGDAGNWDPEEDAAVIKAREALKHANPSWEESTRRPAQAITRHERVALNVYIDGFHQATETLELVPGGVRMFRVDLQSKQDGTLMYGERPNPWGGISWSGVALEGSEQSIKEVERLLHCERRMKDLQAEVVALRGAGNYPKRLHAESDESLAKRVDSWHERAQR